VAREQQIMMHLDIAVGDLDRGVAWAIEAGAIIKGMTCSAADPSVLATNTFALPDRPLTVIV
jgi:hypothetical protein